MRIVVRSREAKDARAAQERLAAAGVDAVALPGPPSPGREAPTGEDVLIIEAMSCGLDAAQPFAEAARARRPLAVLAGLHHDEPPPAGLHLAGAFDGAVALNAPPALLSMQIEAALRAGIAKEELVRRLATAAGFGAAAPKPPEARKLKALYIGPPTPLFLSLERALAAYGGLVAAAFSSYSGFDHLHDDVFDAVVINGASDPMTALSLCAALRRNASLHHLPTLMIINPGDHARAEAAIQRGASAVVEVNAPSGPALGWLFEAIRRERRRRAAEHDLRALRDIMGDARTGLFNTEPFEVHLARLAEDHHANGRPFSLAALRVLPAHGLREPPEAVWKRGFTEIANLSARLIRDADCGSVFGKDLIIVAMPATELIGARRLAERVASVAECTAFAAGEQDVGPLVFEQSAAELQPGESGAALLARALRIFELESATA
ncbi:MAG TPA: hypothetical protein VG841_10680 [Caulobacterales bacterium]|nr:hypothetical protein [Caulobacterales bacterium]